MEKLAAIRYAPKPVLAMLAAAVALLVAAVYSAYSSPAGGFTYPEQLPGGYKVAKVVSGEEAARVTGGIHWNSTRVGSRIKDAAIVVYEDGTRLWIAYTGPNACQLVNRMAEKIAEHEQELPYSRPFQHEIDGTNVYFTVKQLPNGVQQLHAFWCKDGTVVWVEVGAAGSTAQNLVKLLDEMVAGAGYKR